MLGENCQKLFDEIMSNHEKHGEPTAFMAYVGLYHEKKETWSSTNLFKYDSFSLKWNDVRCQYERYKDTVNEMVARNAASYLQ